MEWYQKPGCWVFIVAAIIAVFVGIYVFVNYERVDPGNIGILVDYNERSDVPGQAAYSYQPTGSYVWTGRGRRLVEYPISQRTFTLNGDNASPCRDKNGVGVRTDVQVIWFVDPTRAAELFFKRPNDNVEALEKGLLEREIDTAVDQICPSYTYEEIYGVKKAEMATEAQRRLTAAVASNALVIDRLIFGQTHLGEAQQQALEAKALAIQEAERAQAGKLKAQYEAQTLEEQAKGKQRVAEIDAQAEYDKQVKAAQAAAEARRLAAVADEEAVRKLVAAFGGPENYIAWLNANKWNGQGPTTVFGGSSTPVPVYPVPTPSPSPRP